jgi:hypothetical protein
VQNVTVRANWIKKIFSDEISPFVVYALRLAERNNIQNVCDEDSSIVLSLLLRLFFFIAKSSFSSSTRDDDDDDARAATTRCPYYESVE